MSQGRPAFQIPRPSTAIQAILAVNIGVALLTALLGPTGVFGESLVEWLGVTWGGLWEGYGLGLLRLFTYQFAHGGVWHIVINLLVFWIFARITEQDTGDRGLWHLYLVGGVFGAVFQLLLRWAAGFPDDIPLIGASGSVYAVLVYAARMAPRMEILLFMVLPIQLRWLALFLVLIGVFESLNQLHGFPDGTAHAAHLGGAFYGWLAFERFRGFYLRAQHQPRAMFAWFDRWQASRRRQKVEDLQETMDRLLEKVHRDGIHSLSAGERRTLDRVSRELKRR